MNKLFKDSDYVIPPKVPHFFSQTFRQHVILAEKRIIQLKI